ncbi:MAG: metalloregulator ArsR/SmtB family transcription factor [Candidatus Krumholzibacteriia bacterium]
MAHVTTDPAAIFQALSDPTRLRLLRLLRRDELTVQDLVRILEMSQPRISKHLAILRDTGWAIQRREGTWSWYRTVEPGAFPGGRQLAEQVLRAADRVAEAGADDAGLALVQREREEKARDFFAGVAERWDQIRSEYEHPDLHLGALSALVPRRQRVVDIGTGTGALLPLLAAAVDRVVAVDSSAAMLMRARQLCLRQGLAHVDFQQADVRALPLADSSCDAAYGAMVLHHVPRPEDALAEMVRVVRPGGQVVVVAFTRHDLQWLRDELAHQRLGFAREEMEALLRGAGLVPRSWMVRSPAASAGRPPAGRSGRRWRFPDVFLAVAEKPAAG